MSRHEVLVLGIMIAPETEIETGTLAIAETETETKTTATVQSRLAGLRTRPLLLVHQAACLVFSEA